jgi:hypothetical protein
MVAGYLLGAEEVLVVDVVEGYLVCRRKNQTISKLNPREHFSSWTPPQAAINL